ncbi:hypothetical protein N9K82_01845 [Gammaproteobacteria bacterium]|nr:hypothetical protein [Gammaproteobacteria bacterium]
MTKNRNEIGIYVQSFDMKYPMVYWEGNPGSPSLVSNQMIKVGKALDYPNRMKKYERTFGFRASEPNWKSIRDYYAKKGITDLNFNRCDGCDSKEPHHHVKREYFRSTGLISSDTKVLNDINLEIEGHIGEVFKEHKIKGFNNKGTLKEYYCKSQLQNVIKEIDCFIEEKEKQIK